MTILLINPPLNPPRRTSFVPLGLAYLSSTLKRNGYRVECIDSCNMGWHQLENKLHEIKPDIAGITCWTFNRANASKTSKIIKKVNPNSKIIVGGQHATLLPDQTIKATNADFLVLGEGENSIVELVKAIESNKDFSQIQGIAFNDSGNTVINSPRQFIKNLDEIAFPDYTDFNLDNYLGLPGEGYGRRAAGIITSRGCPYDCSYCSSKEFWTRKWRFRSAENILEEIEFLYFQLGVRALTIFDDNFTINKDRAIKVCQGIIERGLDLKWISIASVRAVDEEILTWMKRAGCYQVQYGVESGSPKILKSINKQQTVEQIIKAFDITKKVGMEPYAYLFIGGPGETEKTVDETIMLMRKIAPGQGSSGGILWILPGTKIYEIAKNLQIITDDTWTNNNDQYMLFTGEHSLKELTKLHFRLQKGLAKNKSIKYLMIFLFKFNFKKIKFLHHFYIYLRDSFFTINKSIFRWKEIK